MYEYFAFGDECLDDLFEVFGIVFAEILEQDVRIVMHGYTTNDKIIKFIIRIKYYCH